MSNTYTVGPNAGQLATLDLVPWENLGPGDVVNVAYKATAYKGKFAINGHGTAAAPITVRGLPGPNGERPIIEGDGATTRATCNYGRDSAKADNQSWGIVYIGPKGTEVDVSSPSYITITGLKFQKAHPSYTYRDMAGASHAYNSFGAAIVVDKSHNVSIVDCEIVDTAQAIWTRSFEGSDASRTIDLLVSRCRVSNFGIVGDDHEHGMYIQAVTPIVEFCTVTSARAGAGGNAIKDRSVGPVYRYNRLSCGSYKLDLVEAEDFIDYATGDPRYRKTFVYGNIFDGGGVLGIHYGGDNGSYRGGTLYCYGNTFSMHGDLENHNTAVWLSRISTLGETVEFFNNVVYMNPALQWMAFRIPQDVGGGPTGGTLNFGPNWVMHNWVDGDGGHPVQGPMNGVANLIVGPVSNTAPIDLATFVPVSGGQAIGRAQALPAACSAYPVTMQIDANSNVTTRATAGNLGAIEGANGSPPPPPANVAPVAGFTFTATDLSVAFVDTSTDSDGSIASRVWLFGDGSKGTGATPVHAYASAATYSVSLTVVDNAGASSTITKPVTVTAAVVIVPPPPPPSTVLSVLESGKWVVSGGSAHATKDEAIEEAATLAAAHPGVSIAITPPTFSVKVQ